MDNIKSKKDILDVYQSKYRGKLFKLNKKFKLPSRVLDKCIRKELPDWKIYKELHNEHYKLGNKYNKINITESQKRKAILYGRIISGLLSDMNIHFKNKVKYLDIGSEDFYIPTMIGSDIDASEVDCINIEDWESESYNIENNSIESNENIPGYNKNTKYTFTFYDGVNIPKKDNSINLVSSFMVLHHVLKLDELLTDVYRVMKKGGVFVIREHDSYDKTYSKYLDIIHYYYDLVITNSKEDKVSEMIQYNTTYFTQKALVNKITNKGFKLLKIIPTKWSDAYFAFFMKE
jgi:SAM-dependent methyltransferase